jgi:8-oxo-dGTP pyrophosphatase MutT (NUDIX family)
VKWTVHGERTIYESPWVSLTLVDVEVPGGARFEHHVVRAASAAVGVVVHDRDRGVLMLWRHRFMTDAWGWEIPAGAVDPGESHEVASAREVLEETGWRPGPLTRWTTFHPMSGRSDQLFEVFGAEGAEHVGEPTDRSEAERVAWVPRDQIRGLIASGDIHDGMSILGLLWWLSLEA